MREIRKPSGDRVRYTYDAFARRVSKDVVPAERLDMPAMIRLAVERGKDALPKVRVTEYLWDGDALAAEVDSERGQRTFVDEPGTLVPLLQAEQGEVFTVVNDHLGMPKELVDQDGRVAWSAAHSAWGRVEETWRDPLSGRGKRERAVESPFRLLGQYEDGDAGLCYTRYRWFDAGTGRWCSPDPLGMGGGTNLLGFGGAPTTHADRLGLCATDSTGRPLSSEQYSVAFEAQLAPGDYPGRSDEYHFSVANKQLFEAMQSSPEFAAAIQEQYPGIKEGVELGPRGGFPREAPTDNVTWHHHPDEPGVMQLVPTGQHEAPGAVQQNLHPDRKGGMQNWGGGRKRNK